MGGKFKALALRGLSQIETPTMGRSEIKAASSQISAHPAFEEFLWRPSSRSRKNPMRTKCFWGKSSGAQKLLKKVNIRKLARKTPAIRRRLRGEGLGVVVQAN